VTAPENLPDLGRANHERAQMRGVEGQRGAPLWTGSAGGQRGASGKLAELAGDLAEAVDGDRHLVIEPVSADDLDRALKHEPGRRLSLTDGEHDIAGCEGPCVTAGKASGRLDLHIVEHREHLVMTGLDQAHLRVSC
jgi:hypothetical protein